MDEVVTPRETVRMPLRMGRPRKSDDAKRSKPVTVGFTPREFEELSKLCRELRETRGGFCARATLAVIDSYKQG